MREPLTAPYVASTKKAHDVAEYQKEQDRQLQRNRALQFQRPLPTTDAHDPTYHLMAKHIAKPGAWRDSKRHVPVVPTHGRQYDKIPQNNLNVLQHKGSVRAWGDVKDTRKEIAYEQCVEEELEMEGDTLDLSE